MVFLFSFCMLWTMKQSVTEFWSVVIANLCCICWLWAANTGRSLMCWIKHWVRTVKITQFLTKPLTFLCDSDEDGVRWKVDLCLIQELGGQQPWRNVKCSDTSLAQVMSVPRSQHSKLLFCKRRQKSLFQLHWINIFQSLRATYALELFFIFFLLKGTINQDVWCTVLHREGSLQALVVFNCTRERTEALRESMLAQFSCKGKNVHVVHILVKDTFSCPTALHCESIFLPKTILESF